MILSAGSTRVEVTALTDDIFRVGVFPEGMPVEYRSEAVVFDREPSDDLGRVRVEGNRISFEHTAASSPPTTVTSSPVA